MKRVVAFLISLICSGTALQAQRMNMTPEDGQNGLIWGMLLIVTVALITLLMYWRQKRKSSK